MATEKRRYFGDIGARFRSWFTERGLDATALLREQERRGTPEIRVAPIIYTAAHFGEVDQLVAGGMKQAAAFDTVVESYGFGSREGFEKMYRRRHLNKKIKPASP